MAPKGKDRAGPESWRFTVATAKTAPIPEGARSAPIFTHGSMVLRYYAPKGVDRQTPHDQDELYVIASGRGSFVVDGARHPFQPGDVLFAPARAEHRFEGFTDDFATWVVFYGPKGGEKP
jgi:mannose-6-phosphate isomerase-like protein (cupin superfamily)